jgi:hypothetical protein
MFLIKRFTPPLYCLFAAHPNKLITKQWRSKILGSHLSVSPTIDAYFDADRLDLGRIDIIPCPEKMATKKGKKTGRSKSRKILI